MPLPAIIAALAPILIGEVAKAAIGDTPTAGKVADTAVSIISDVSGIPINTPDDASRAVAAVQADPVKLAEVYRLQAETTVKLIAMDNEDRASARGQTVALAQAGSAIAWGAPIVSVLVVAGYFTVMWRLFGADSDAPPNVFALLNMLFGALTIGFGQVCNYWLGSSAGSKAKDDALRSRS